MLELARAFRPRSWFQFACARTEPRKGVLTFWKLLPILRLLISLFVPFAGRYRARPTFFSSCRANFCRKLFFITAHRRQKPLRTSTLFSQCPDSLSHASQHLSLGKLVSHASCCPLLIGVAFQLRKVRNDLYEKQRHDQYYNPSKRRRSCVAARRLPRWPRGWTWVRRTPSETA